MTTTVSASLLRQNLKKILDIVSKNKVPTVITRKGSEDMILMPISEFSSWEETIHLLSSPANAKALQKSIEESAENKIVRHKLKSA